ncbi:hypothetical protein [Polyangium spumosum]|uniref:Uncharacterized protein n=1 Tax=Polyangium spumosum TaxID=889282 RepID=A0A6N7Q5K1_9BACT|nr:hypothetical protein [Polyangium spumosum]MRG96121.1 hypothetical protein [Polyangium spumosum]
MQITGRMMHITNDIPRRQKIYFIRPSRYHVFGTNFEKRDMMSDDEAVCCFDDTWDATIRQAIIHGDPVEYEDVLGLIPEHSRPFCHHDHEHRRFRILGTVFVAQLKKRGDNYSHNQMWPVPAKNYDTRTLFLTFATQAERDDWDLLAARLGYDSEELGLRVLHGFAAAFGATQQAIATAGAGSDGPSLDPSPQPHDAPNRGLGRRG